VDDIVAVVETDKVTVDIKTEYGGVLTAIMAAVGETVNIKSIFNLNYLKKSKRKHFHLP